MDHVSGMLKSSNSSIMPYGKKFLAGPGLESKKESSFCTAKRILKNCALYFDGSVKPEKIVGLKLVPIIVNEPRFKVGIVRRWELPLRSKSVNVSHVKTSDQKNCDATRPITNSKSLQHLVLENKCDNGSELLPVQDNETTSVPFIVVNDIKSFALLDAKFREDEERNRLNRVSATWTEEFIQDIRPTYSDDASEKCIINEQEQDIKAAASKSKSEILSDLMRDSPTEVIMSPRQSSPQKSDSVIDKENVIEKKPTLSKLKLTKPGKEMFKCEKERGWRIKESYDTYSTKRTNRSQSLYSQSSFCGSDVSRGKSASSNHPYVKPAPSTWMLPDPSNTSTGKVRPNKDAGRRIRESFRVFVERQNQGRTLRALKEQETI